MFVAKYPAFRKSTSLTSIHDGVSPWASAVHASDHRVHPFHQVSIIVQLKGEIYTQKSLSFYNQIIGVTVIERKTCLCRAIGAALFMQDLERPPVASFTLLNTIESSSGLPGRPLDIINLSTSILGA